MNESNSLYDRLWMPRQIALDVLANNIQETIKWAKENDLDTTALLYLHTAYRCSSKTYDKASDQKAKKLRGGK